MGAPRLRQIPVRIKTLRPAVLMAIGLGLGFVNLFGLTQTARHPDLVAFDEGRAGPDLKYRLPSQKIQRMMEETGLHDIRISQNVPYWSAVGFTDNPGSSA